MHDLTPIDSLPAFPLEMFQVGLQASPRTLEVLAHAYQETSGWLRFMIILDDTPSTLVETLRIPKEIVSRRPDGSLTVAPADKSAETIEVLHSSRLPDQQ